MNVQQAAPAAQVSPRAYQSTAEAASREDHFDERILVTQAKAGRMSAFSELYKRHLPKALRAAFRILRNKEDSEDAAQRSFQRAFTNLGRFRGDSTFSTWLTRIAINEALMILRHRRLDQRLFESDTNDGPESRVLLLAHNGPTPEETLAENERRTAVTQAISSLRKTLRTVILLSDFQGLTSAEIASSLGLSVAAVKSRLLHARRYLRRHLTRKLQRGRNGLPIRYSDGGMRRFASGVIAKATGLNRECANCGD